MDLRIGPGICQELNQESLPWLFIVISDHLKDIYSLLNTVCYLGLPPSIFFSACTLEFPTNLIDWTIMKLVVHGISESINNLSFTASIQ